MGALWVLLGGVQANPLCNVIAALMGSAAAKGDFYGIQSKEVPERLLPTSR